LQESANILAGNWFGIHCETGIFKMMFGLLMWDILFAEISDVFQTPFQGISSLIPTLTCSDAPLDLMTDAFFTSRAELIEARVLQLQETEDIALEIEKAWFHKGNALGIT
jgi:Fanconi-associated nuclease 1